jgi:hypothetical protein
VKYYGDYIFAFDHYRIDDPKEKRHVEQTLNGLKIWTRYCTKETKLYVLVAFDSQDEKDIEGALAMLKEYDDSTKTVSDLSAETRQRYTRLFTLFPVLKYSLSNYTFMMEGLNDVKYEVIFAEESNPEVNGEPKTFFMFNPVRVDDQWYVTVKRGDQSIHN